MTHNFSMCHLCVISVTLGSRLAINEIRKMIFGIYWPSVSMTHSVVGCGGASTKKAAELKNSGG